MKPQKLLGTFLMIFGMLIGMNGCMEKEFSEIWSDLKKQDARINELEEKLNGDVTNLQELIEATVNADCITEVTGDDNGSYTISFQSGKKITIRPGNDGSSSVIGVKEDSSGKLFWTVDDKWLYDENEDKVQVAAIAPQISINMATGEWEISTDGGKKWISTGIKATVSDELSLFSKKPELSADGKYYTFSLVAGSSFSVPVYQETSLVFSLEGVTVSHLAEAIQLPTANPALDYTIRSSKSSEFTVKASIVGDNYCKATVNPTDATSGNISFTGLTNGKTVSLNVKVLQNGKELTEYLLKITSADNPTTPLPTITNATATAGADKVSVTVTFPKNSTLATLECRLYLNGTEKGSLDKKLTEAEKSSGTCSFDLGSGLAAGTYSLQITPVNAEGGKGSVYTTSTVISSSAALVPAISSVKNTAGADEAGVINLVTYWDSSLNGKITKVIYRLEDANWLEVNNGEMTVYNDRAEVRITGLTPGGKYWPYVTPYIDSTAGDTFHMSDGGLYAGESNTVPPVLSTFTTSQEVSETIKLSVTWDAATYDVARVEYQIYTPDWVEVKTGDMTNVSSGSADVTIELPTANYLMGVFPYASDGTKGEWKQIDLVPVWKGDSGSSTGTGKRLFPMHHLNITQGRGGGYSHKNLNAYDLAGEDSGIDYFTATGTYEVTAVLSLATSGYANTILFYDADNDVTLALVHMNSIDTSKYYVGRKFYAGEVMYMEGTAGQATGNHIHMEIGKGWQNTKPKRVVNGTANYQLANLMDIEDYFYIDSSITVKDACGYTFERR